MIFLINNREVSESEFNFQLDAEIQNYLACSADKDLKQVKQLITDMLITNNRYELPIYRYSKHGKSINGYKVFISCPESIYKLYLHIRSLEFLEDSESLILAREVINAGYHE